MRLGIGRFLPALALAASVKLTSAGVFNRSGFQKLGKPGPPKKFSQRQRRKAKKQ